MKSPIKKIILSSVLVSVSSVIVVIGYAQERRGSSSVSGYVDGGKCIDMEKLFHLYETADIRTNDDYTALFASARKKAVLKIEPEAVTLQLHGNNITQSTKADRTGRFSFDGLVAGEYVIVAEAYSSTTPDAKKLTAGKLVRVIGKSSVVLHLDSEVVTVKGRLLDKEGAPIASAKVIFG